MSLIPSEIELLQNELGQIRKQLIASNSFSRKFFIGLAYGFGTVVGATLLVALFIYILSVLAYFGILGDFNNWLVGVLTR